VQKPTQALKSVKDPANTFDWNTKWARTLPSFDICSWVIYRDPPNPNIKVVFRDSSRHISGGAKAITHGLLEVTSPEAALTGNDVTWSHVTGSYVTAGSMFCVFPRFFLSIVVLQNVPLRMTVSIMATGCDVSESDVTGSDVTGINVIRPKVGDYPWGCDLNCSKCCVVLQWCFLSRSRSHCGIST
jgi:hypothetical protein